MRKMRTKWGGVQYFIIDLNQGMQYLNWLIRLVLALRQWIFVFMLKSKKQLDFISIVGAENNSFKRIFEMNQTIVASIKVNSC
jgi:hypothetical protein